MKRTRIQCLVTNQRIPTVMVLDALVRSPWWLIMGNVAWGLRTIQKLEVIAFKVALKLFYLA